MSIPTSYLVSDANIAQALENDGMTVEDYEPTIFGLVWDGVEWTCLEDSLDEELALEWARRAAGYGEHVGLYVWSGTR